VIRVARDGAGGGKIGLLEQLESLEGLALASER